MKKLYHRLLDICYHNKLHHLGSYFSCLHILDKIHGQMNKDDIFILSNGHAVVALYVILEKYYGLNAQEFLKTPPVRMNLPAATAPTSPALEQNFYFSIEDICKIVLSTVQKVRNN